MIFESRLKDISNINNLVSELEEMYGRKIEIINVFPEHNGYTIMYKTLRKLKSAKVKETRQ